jgi:hypothetical protein
MSVTTDGVNVRQEMSYLTKVSKNVELIALIADEWNMNIWLW